MINLFKLTLLVFGFLYTTSTAFSQCAVDTFTLTPVAGTCASDAQINVQANCTGNLWEAVLIKDGKEEQVLTLDNNGMVSFQNLVPAAFQVKIRKKDGTQESSLKNVTTTTSYVHFVVNGAIQQTPPTCELGKDGKVAVSIRNNTGTGPYQVELLQGGVVKARSAVTPKSGTSGNTTVQVIGDATNPVETGEYQVRVIDYINNKAGCYYAETGRIVRVSSAPKNPEFIAAFYKPRCADCNKYELLVAFQYDPNFPRDPRADGDLKVRVTSSSGTVKCERTINTATDVVQLGTPGVEIPWIDVNNWRRLSYRFFKGVCDVEEGDKLSLVFDDHCSNTPDVTANYTINYSATQTGNFNYTLGTQRLVIPRPINDIEEIVDPNCIRQGYRLNLGLKTHRGDTWNYWLRNTKEMYSMFCESTLTMRLLKQNGSNWNVVPGTEKDIKVGDFVQGTGDINADGTLRPLEHLDITSNGNYRVEVYVKSNVNGADKSRCKYFSYDLSVNTINTSTMGQLPERAAVASLWKYSLIEGTSPGLILNYATGNNGGVTYSSANPLTVQIRPTDGRASDTVTATGPWSLAQPYTVTYPITYQKTDNVQNIIYDLPPGEYQVTYKTSCLTRTQTIQIPSNPAVYTPKVEVMGGCRGGAVVKYDLGGNSVVEGIETHGASIFRDTNPSGALGQITHADAKSRVGAWVASFAVRQSGVKGEFHNILPGRYLLKIQSTMSWYNQSFTVMDNPTNGYAIGTGQDQSITGGYYKKPYIHEIYYSFEVKAEESVSLNPMATLCDPHDPTTGVVGVEIGSGTPSFPITYQLWIQNKTTQALTRAKDNTGAEVPFHVISTKPADGNTYHAFTKLPRLNYATEEYMVRLVTACNEEGYPIPDFDPKNNTDIFTSGDNLCPGSALTLDIGLPSSIYNFTWHSSINNIPASEKNKKRITINPTQTAEYWVTYQAKDASICGNTAVASSNKTTVTVKTDAVSPVISLVSDSVLTVLSGDCSFTYGWVKPTVSDAEGCLKSVTWRVEDSLGNKLYPLSGENDDTVATSWSFPIGVSTVIYTAEDTSGNVSTMRFKVTVLPSTVALSLTDSYVDAFGVAKTSVSVGERVYYKLTLRNTGDENLRDMVLRVVLPSGNNVTLPTVGQVDVSELVGATTPSVVYDGTTRTYTISNISEGLFTRNSTAKSIVFPLLVGGSCSDYQTGCTTLLSSESKVTYSGGNVNCLVTGQEVTTSRAVNVDTSLLCSRQELFCGSTQVLTASGTGYMGYEWYMNGVVIPGATSSSYTATQSGAYKVLRRVTCNGVSVTSEETINLLDTNGLVANDPIRAQSDGGATCGDTGQWVSHFFLCDGTSKTLNVTFNDSQRISWQSYKTSCTYSRANCQSREDSCWGEVATGRSYVISNSGNYRLRVTGNGCTHDFYFTVYTDGLGGVVSKRDQDDNGLGSVTVTMDTSGQPYTYVLKEGSTVLSTVNSTQSEYTFTGLQIPKGTSKTYTVEVTSSAIPHCKLTKTIVVEDKTTMTVSGEFLTWIDCSDGNFRFTAEGGRTPYRVALYSIDGVLQHPTAATLEHIPDSAFTLGAGQSPFTEVFTITSPGSYYRFVIRDSSGQNILTNSILVTHNANFQTEISATDIICSGDTSTVTARFLPSLGIGQRVKLYRGSVSASNLVGENNSGIFTGISAGSYVAVIETLLGKVCSFERIVEVKRLFEPLVGFVGVEKDILCEPSRGYKININNVFGGKPPYKYSFTGGNVGTFFDSNTGYISNSTSVYVQDSNGCVLELPVVVDPALQQPTLPSDLHTLITYDCQGNAHLTLTPVAPSGKTYTYEYEVDGNATTNTLVLPPKSGGGSYTINIYYKDSNATITQSNVLFREDFGTGSDVSNSSVRLAYTPSVSLIDGSYTITSSLVSSSEYGFPTAGVVSGRYLAGVPTPSSSLIYERVIKNVIPQKSVSVSLKYINLLLSSTVGKHNPSLRLELVVGGTTYTRSIPAIGKDTNWQEVKFEFTELNAVTQTETEVRLRLLSDASTSTAVGIDDLLVSQQTQTCRVPLTRVVTPLSGQGFNPVVVDTQDAKCEGGKGLVYVEVTNNRGATSLDYSVDGINWHTANLLTGSTTRFSFELLAGTHQLRFRRDTCVITAPSSVTINEPAKVTLPTAKMSATPVGCVVPFLTSTVTMTIEGGTRPYQSVRYREVGTTTWLTTGAVIASDRAIVSGLVSGKTYEFTVTDANNCSLGEVMGSYTIPTKVDVTLDVTPTRCYVEGQGEIKVEVQTGTGPYRFSKDNGITFEYNPDDINATQITYEGLDSGTYTLVVEDALGCRATRTVTIYPSLTLQVTNDGGFDCSSSPTEKITLEVNGGKGQHRFKWRRGLVGAYRASTDTDSGKVLFGTPTVVGSRTLVEVTVHEQGYYYFEVSDENYDVFGVGCLQTGAVEVKAESPAWQNGLVLAADDILCEGASTGMIGVRQGTTIRQINLTTDIDGTRGVAPYNILVYPKVGGIVNETTNVGTRNLSAGTYVVRLQDSKGCVSSDVEVIIGQKPKVNVTAVKTADVVCSSTGSFNYGSITSTWTSGGTPPFTASLYTSSGVLARQVVSSGVHQYTNKGQVETLVFNELVSGTYTVVLVDSNGCRVETAPVTIDGLATNLVVEPLVATCTSAGAKLIAYNPTTAIVPAGVRFAVYTGGDPALYPSTAWTNGVAGTYTVGGSTFVSAEATISGLVPGVTYRFVVNNNGCYSFTEATMMRTNTTTQVDSVTGFVACSGNDGKVGFKLSNIPSGVTSMSYQIYNYPANTPVGSSVSILVSGGGVSYEEVSNTLGAGEYYVVFTEGVTGCIVASTPFTIVKPDVPLSVRLTLTKNETCTDSARIVAHVTGGKSGYKYIFKNNNGQPTSVDWAGVTAIQNQQLEERTGIHLSSTLTGRWYVFVQDSNGCVSEADVIIVKDATPTILSANVENLCASNGNYHLRVTMGSLGAGQHYYTIKRNGITSSMRPIAFTLNSSGQNEFLVTNIYSDSSPQEVVVYDFNRCSSSAVTFDVSSRLTYDARVTRKLSCNTPSSGEITLNNFSKAGLTYSYKVHMVTTQFSTDPLTGDIIQTEVETVVHPLVAGSTTETFAVNTSGKYRIYVYDAASPDCPIVKDVIVNERELPIVTQELVVDEQCPSTPSIGAGTGKVTVSAGSLSIGGFSFKIVHAVDLTYNSTVAVPTSYATAHSSSLAGVIEVDASQTRATYEGLMGTPQGIRYHIVATSLTNGCESIPLQVTVRAPFPILIAPNSVQVTQFVCDSSQELQQAKIRLNTSGVSGGTAPYTYVFKKSGVEVQRSRNSELLVYDRAGGTYTLEIVDENGCVFVDTNTYVINPFISMESVTASLTTLATCLTGESINISVTTDPSSVVPTNGFTYRVEKSGVLKTVTATSPQVTITDLEIGTYRITVTNNDTGCSIYTSYQVQDPNTFVVTASDATRVTCFGGNDGQVTLTFVDTDHNNGDQSASGFSYTITNIYDSTAPVITGSSTTPVAQVTGLVAGTYRVVATSTTGCQTQQASEFSIRQAYEALSAGAKAEYQPTCTNDQGEILVSVMGGVTPYTITINGTNGTTRTQTGVYDRALFVGLDGGTTPGTMATYTITVTDAWGCTITLTDQPQLERPLDITYTYTVTNPTCVEGDNGSIALTSVSGGSGVGTYYYELQGITNSRYYLQRDTNFTGLIAGVYKLTITDRWGCQQTVNITLTDPSNVVITEIDKSEAVCFEDTTGFITVQVSGGTPGTMGYTVELVNSVTGIVRGYQQNVQPNTNVTFTGLSPQIRYEIRVVDSQGCRSKDVHSFELEHLPDLTAKIEYSESCVNNSYEGRILVEFSQTLDWTKVRYAINSTNLSDSRAFDGAELNVAYIIVDANTPKGEQMMTIFYVQPSKIPSKPDIVCSHQSNKYFVRAHQTLALERDTRYELAVNELKVQGKYGVEPYRYFFNGQYAGDNSIYLVKRTDPEAIEPTTGRMMKYILVRVEDYLGCVAELPIYFEYIDVRIPNYFTPTADGINDGWSPEYTDHYPNMIVEIYDRYGRPIAQLRQGQKWDGKYNGKELPAGDYWYIFKLNQEDDPREFKGHFTLYR